MNYNTWGNRIAVFIRRDILWRIFNVWAYKKKKKKKAKTYNVKYVGRR